MNLKTSQLTSFSNMFLKLISFEGNTACSVCRIIAKKTENFTRSFPWTTSITQVIAEGSYFKSTRN